ncbi:MAG TPA: PilZ domain-containing protein [Sphingomonas sp.]|jgi:hypothetical protein|uniref:PilZ domain-containing protein n=1 Tax=Sphingomonas sp. TaxID=28214 RepID=UPI002EDB2649
MAATHHYSPVPSTDRRDADRRPVDRPSTFRPDSAAPVDVVVHDLSATGFRVAIDNPPLIGTAVSIGLPGLGRRTGTVTRLTADGAACQFTTPLDIASVTQAFAVDPVVIGPFIALPTPDLDLDHEPHVDKWHPALRLTLILAITSAAWTTIFHLI